MKQWNVKFAYSGCGTREFFTVKFSNEPVQFGDNPQNDINTRIKDYVEKQNEGETKPDQIRYWSKEELILT